jgi:integrase
VRQLSFLDPAGAAPPTPADPEGEALLAAFRAARLDEGASPASVRREVAQLRALARVVGGAAGPASPATLLARPDLVARALREPRAAVARATGRARLVAIQRFVELVGPRLGRDPAADRAALDRLLPRRRGRGWHDGGVAVAGGRGCRRRGPTLGPAELARLVEAAAEGRDRTLVALACYSGLRPEELAALRWEDLAVAGGGYGGPAARVTRRGQAVWLPLAEPARAAVEARAAALGGAVGALAGPVLPRRGEPGRALSYRAARDVLAAACRRAGLPPATAAELRAGCAWWLRTQGLSDHEVMAVLGLASVRAVDRLLAGHRALAAQRRVREVLA